MRKLMERVKWAYNCVKQKTKVNILMEVLYGSGFPLKKMSRIFKYVKIAFEPHFETRE